MITEGVIAMILLNQYTSKNKQYAKNFCNVIRIYYIFILIEMLSADQKSIS